MKKLLFLATSFLFLSFANPSLGQGIDPPVLPGDNASVSLRQASPSLLSVIFHVEAEDAQVELVRYSDGCLVFHFSEVVYNDQHVDICLTRFGFGRYAVRVKIEGVIVEEATVEVE